MIGEGPRQPRDTLENCCYPSEFAEKDTWPMFRQAPADDAEQIEAMVKTKIERRVRHDTRLWLIVCARESIVIS